MKCEACGHNWLEHRNRYGVSIPGLCEVCFHETGPCFPWEFR